MRRSWYAPSSVEPARRSRRAQLLDRGALLAEERAAEPGDERAEDLALVVVVGAEAEARARPQLAARAGQPAVVRVPVELLVLDAHVVGPREDLPVQALHVVALVERVDDGLPVRVDDRAERYARKRISSRWYGASSVGQRIEEVEQRLGVEVEVDEHEAAPACRRAPAASARSSGRPANSSRSGTSTSRPSSA